MQEGVSATVYSPIETAKSMEPYAYFPQVLQHIAIADTEDKIDTLLS
jgi:hypothetical protein